MSHLTLASLSLALVSPFSSPAEVLREDEHFRLVCHFEDQAAADQAFAAVQAVWAHAEELYSIQDEGNGKPLEIHLYRDAAAYELAEQGLTQGAFRRNLAFAHVDTQTAHVALQPPLGDAALAETGLPAQTLRLLAHEAAHLVRYGWAPNSRSHPSWIVDGAASYIDEAVLEQLGILKGLEEYPDFSTSLVRVQGLLDEDRLPAAEEILFDQVDGLSFYERYDVRWLFFRYLMEEGYAEEMGELMAEMRRLGGGVDFTQRLFEAAPQLSSKKKLSLIDRGFRKYVRTFEPVWEQVYRDLQPTEAGWLQAAFDSNAIAWRRKPSGKRYEIRGEIKLLPGPREQLNLFLGRSENGFVSAAFTAGSGVNLFEYLSATNTWEPLGFEECSAVRRGETFAFTATVAGQKVSLEVNGEKILSAEAQTMTLDGPWGLSAQANSAGIWNILEAPGF